MKFKVAALIVALGLSGTQAMAQTESENAGGQPATQQSPIKVRDSNGEIRPARCSDFVHNPDGSWSPNKPVMIGQGISMGTGVSFTEGVTMAGINVASALNAQCLNHQDK
ncbi:hypothetical protein [Acetobacter malorum]|uniref:hypothetical protein n=1 Tax=Acetobacter malorum TaxID=178901 RepID=UPI00248E38F8|nr:hypothetical protein [Acetobacter malorum]